MWRTSGLSANVIQSTYATIPSHSKCPSKAVFIAIVRFTHVVHVLLEVELRSVYTNYDQTVLTVLCIPGAATRSRDRTRQLSRHRDQRQTTERDEAALPLLRSLFGPPHLESNVTGDGTGGSWPAQQAISIRARPVP